MSDSKVSRRQALCALIASGIVSFRAVEGTNESTDLLLDGWPLMWSEGGDEMRGEVFHCGPNEDDVWVVTSQRFWTGAKYVWVCQPLDPASPLKRELEEHARLVGSRVMEPSRFNPCC